MLRMKKVEIIVIGGCHHNMLGVIRSLGEKGLLCNVVIETSDKHPYIAKSKYIKKMWMASNSQQVLDILRNESSFFIEKPVVIACSDNLSSLLDLHYNELSKYYSLPGSEEQGRITHLMDKEVMSQLALEIGFNVPESKAINTTRVDSISFEMPWIIKPLISKDGYKSDIKRIHSQQEWADYIMHHHSMVQVQKLIDKDFEYQLIGLSLDKGNEVIIPGISYVIRPQATTNTGFLRYEPLCDSYLDLLALCKRFLKRTCYSGLFSMEFVRGKNGVDYFMEINFRNDGNAICVTASGLNLPYIWYLYNSNESYQQEIERCLIRPVYVMPEFADISLLSHGHLKLLKWLKDIHRTDRFMEFDKHDMAPFFFYFYYRALSLIKKKFKMFEIK